VKEASLLRAKVERESAAGVDVVTLRRPAFSHAYLTGRSEGTPGTTIAGDVVSLCRTKNLRILAQNVFGSRELRDEGVERTARVFGDISWPVAWIEGNGGNSSCVRGTQIQAVSGVDVRPVWSGGRPVGSAFEDENARYCLLADIQPSRRDDTRTSQTRDVLENIEGALRTVDMDFSDVVRTWFFLDDILSWYGDFNKVRTQFLEERGVFTGLVPASTGVGVRNTAGAVLTAGALAIRPKNGSVRVEVVPSPLQCPATNYRSSFSRAIEVRLPDCRTLHISGTASIDSEGKTAHAGDMRRQIELTMEVVETILKSRGMGWENAARAIAYFKDMNDAPLFDEYCTNKGMPHLPLAVAHADICRDDLLFEIEADAIAAE
jgi:enamine deaminase RidA (YjgF/YER057c/UK114 family)